MTSKLYIAVLTDVPDFMVPTLVAHTILGAHLKYTSTECEGVDYKSFKIYEDWLRNSFRKVVLRVNTKEFDKIQSTLECYSGHENTTLGGMPSCLVVLPVESDNVPNVLKFGRMWAPKKEKQDEH